MGHGKASRFPGWKQLFHGVCWCILCISLLISQYASQWLVVQLRKWQRNNIDSKVAAVMFLSFSFRTCINSLCLVSFHSYLCGCTFWICDACACSAGCLVYLYCTRNEKFNWCFTKGHEKQTSTNAFSCFTLYPAVFMACHHLLWILLGIITEPFWGISVLVAVLSISAILFFLTYEFHKAFPSPECSLPFIMSSILIPGIFLAFVLLIFVLLVISQSFLSESLISTLVQNGLVFFATLWFGYLKLDPDRGTVRQGGEREERIALRQPQEGSN